MLGLCLHELEGGLGGGGLRGGKGGAEDRVLGVGAQIFDILALAGDETARAAERFGEAADDEVDLVGEAEVVRGAAALAAEHAEAVGVVEHVETVELLGGGDQLGEVSDVAFHRVHAFDDEQLRDVGRHGASGGAQFVGVVVGEALDGGVGEADTVPEAGMDVFVGEDDVALGGEGRDAG